MFKAFRIPSSCHALLSSVFNLMRPLLGVCGTTESIWACLACPNFACGRTENEGHAYKHFQATKHPFVLEITKKFIHW